MGVSSEIAAVSDKFRVWIESQLTARVTAVLHELEFFWRDQEFFVLAARLEGLIPLIQELRSQHGWLHQELGDIGPQDISISRSNLPPEEVLGCDRERELEIFVTIQKG